MKIVTFSKEHRKEANRLVLENPRVHQQCGAKDRVVESGKAEMMEG